MINRTIPPALKPIDHIEFLAPEKHALSDCVNLYHTKDVPDETCRFDFYFDAGKCRGLKGIPNFVNGLLLSGTKGKSSIQIHDEINGKGGFFESGVSIENSVISVYCLRENFQSIFDTIIDAIKNVDFIEKEVNEFLSDSKQKLKINLSKMSYLAQVEFQIALFESNEFYSNTLTLNDFEEITSAQLIDFHAKHYLKGLSKVVVVGNLEDDIIQNVIRETKEIALPSKADFESTIVNKKGEKYDEKDDAIQSAIRVGRILFNKNHPDYLDFVVLNTILGDYFGSRLMANIREDKGYTYGIGSMMAELNEFGYFLIATEVRKDVQAHTIDEIKFEFNRLQTELVTEGELALVKNYMLGQLLKSADGAYAMTDLFLSAEAQGKDLDFYNDALHAVRSITSERIKELANTYLNWEDYTVISVG
mgnify:FL=1